MGIQGKGICLNGFSKGPVLCFRDSGSWRPPLPLPSPSPGPSLLWPSDSEIEGGLWPEGLEGEGGRPLWEEEQCYQLQNRMFDPGHRWRGRALSKWKAVRNMLESASRAMEFSFFNIPFKHIL